MKGKQNISLLVFLAGIFLSSIAIAQSTPKNMSEKDILNIYEKQLTTGFQVRAMGESEIKKYIEKGKEGVASMEDFANSLSNLLPYRTQSSTAVLFFFFNNDTLYRFFIIPGKIKEQKVIPIKAKDLEQLNSDVYSTLHIYNLAANRAPQIRGLTPKAQKPPANMTFEKAINNATKILLPELFDEQYSNLIIIPAFSIGAFPFQLLKPYKDGSYLIDKCSFSIAPGIMDLVAIRKRMIKRNEAAEDSASFTFSNTLFVCNPDFPVNTDYIFPPLPGAKKEIENSLAYSEKYILLEGKNATRQNVMDNIRNCDVAYFATHGISDDKDPLDNNFLVLAGDKDPFLTSRNILSMRDSTFTEESKFPELVILSACQTGLGKSMEAGIFGGLARSFLIAGANQVIMSLWNVDDEATAYLMNRFVYYLQQPNLFVPSEPLRLAELDTRKKFPDPSQWASFSVYGVNY